MEVPDMRSGILALGEFLPSALESLAQTFDIHHFVEAPASVADAIGAAAASTVCGILMEPNRAVTKSVLDALPNLQIVSIVGVGFDALDLGATKARGIAVTNTPGILADDVADFAMALLLASARQIVEGDRFVREGRWRHGAMPLGRSISGKTVGVLGLGQIGSAIARRAEAFGMMVLYTDMMPKADARYPFVPDLVELARRSEFLVAACSGGPQTRRIVNEQVLAALGPAGTLVNISRGSVVDEDALIRMLHDGRLGHAALDVFDSEPDVSAALLALPNVIAEPHHAAGTIETRTRMSALAIANLKAKLAGDPLLTPVAI
jgi:lactate dehydrogenase-like 2-hydroxyacid dehydrogenase